MGSYFFIMLLIFVVLPSTLAEAKDVPRNHIQKCGRGKVYVQYKLPASGWYHFNRETEKFERVFKDMKYTLQRQNSNQWSLHEWTEIYRILHLKTIQHKGDNPLGIGMRTGNRYSNVVTSMSQVQPETSRIATDQPSYLHNDRDDSSSAEYDNTRVKIHSPASKGDEIYFPTLKVFCPGRCLCKRALMPQLRMEFLRSDLMDRAILESCKRYKLWNFYIIADIIAGEVSNCTSLDNQWKPHIFLTEDCNLLYFDECYHAWGIYMPGNAPETGRGFTTLFSTDSGPCLEFLPEGRFQNWFWTDSDHEDSDDIQKSKNLQLFCTSMEKSTRFDARPIRVKTTKLTTL